MNQKSKVTIYTKIFCPYCINAKAFFNEQGIEFNEVTLEENSEEIERLKAESGWKTLPMIMINGKMIGGYSDMKVLHKDGKLELMISQSI